MKEVAHLKLKLPRKVHRKLKVQAVAHEVTLPEWATRVLTTATGFPVPKAKVEGQ